MTLPLRLLAGVGIAAAIAGAASRARLLTGSGAIAATGIGAACVAAGVEWVVVLLFFFVTSSAMSRWGLGEKDRRTGSIVEKGARRDAAQVAANGAVFAGAAVASLVADPLPWGALAAGAMAAATADTWSTELGTLFGGAPRDIVRGTAVPPGASGGITVVGSIAAVAGALVSAGVARGVGLTTAFGAVVAGGVAGALADSLLGALVQERRWCEACGAFTERRLHSCGRVTLVRGGVPGLGNDAVNLTSTALGAVVTWLLT
jgi:uncharacterized protein (TIGR00297 family)